MKAVLTVKMRSGYLIVEREIGSLTMEEISTGTVVEDDSWSHRDKVGRVAADILSPQKPETAEGEAA